MEAMEQHHPTRSYSDQLLADNHRLLAEARSDRVRHQTAIRRAQRRFEGGLAAVRRATLYVIQGKPETGS